VLVTGATGSLGAPVVRLLIAEGFDVTALARRTPPPGLLPPEARFASCDVRSEADVGSLVMPGGLVVHLAGPTQRLGLQRLSVTVRGTATVMRAACNAGASRVVLASTIHVYAPTERGEVADETTPPRPRSRYGRSKLAAEKVAWAIAAEAGAPELVILRIAAAYGPGATGGMARLQRILRAGSFAVAPWSSSRRTIVHVEDVSSAIVAAATHPGVAGDTLNVTDGGVRTIAEIVMALAVVAGRPTPPIRVPWLGRDLAVDGSRMQQVLGITARHKLGAPGK
jgi:nucleoside-diphosphate-sugar epimerase